MTHQPATDDDIALQLGLDKPQKSKKPKILFIAGILILAMVIFLWFALTKNNDPTIKYQVERVKKGNIIQIVSATGVLAPRDQLEVGTEVSGTVKEVLVDYNDRVTQGQVMARLDPTKLNTQVVQSRAALDLAQARLIQSQATVEDMQNRLNRLQQSFALSGGKVPSQLDLDSARTNLKQARADESAAKAQIDQARATLEGNQSDLAKAVIQSPIDGIILKRSVEAGQTVAASLQTPVLFTIARDLAAMELIVDVDEADVGRVSEGQRAEFTVDAYPERRFLAVITQVRFSPTTTSGVVTYETLLEVQNTDLLLRPGMTATADITVNAVNDAILVPNAALRFTPQAMAAAPQDQRGFVDRLMPGPRRRFNRTKTTTLTSAPKTGQVWLLKDKIPVMSTVSLGISDGLLTEIIGGDIQPDDPLIVDERVSK